MEDNLFEKNEEKQKLGPLNETWIHPVCTLSVGTTLRQMVLQRVMALVSSGQLQILVWR
jgi:hypothetical protein